MNKDRETKPWPRRVAKKAILSLRGAVRDEAISVFGQRLLRSARNDTLTLCHAVGVLSHGPKLYFFALILLALGWGFNDLSILHAEPSPAAYFPLAVGNRWVYESSESTAVTPVVESWEVTRQEGNAFVVQVKQSYLTAGGVEEFFVSTAEGIRRGDRPAASIEAVGTEPRFFLKAPLTVGATWKNADGKYTVTAIDETVAVPAGTFTNCVEVTHSSASGSVTTVTLYAPDVGMVQRDETFAVIGSGLGSFDASQFGKGMGGGEVPQRGHAVLRLKERKIPMNH
jgi:hypothetical protein